jgi:hypothetical protein
MPKRSWGLPLLVLLLGAGTVARAQTSTGFVTVDFISLQRHTSQPDLAFSSSGPIAGVGGPGSVDFEHPSQFVPRLSAELAITEDWGISSNYFRTPTSNQIFSFTNSSPTLLVASAALPYGPTAVTSTITGGGPRLPTAVNVPLSLQVLSPSTFYYLPLLPTATLFRQPHAPNNPAGTPIPASGSFEYTSSVQAGFSDPLSFQSLFRVEQGDLMLTRYLDMGAGDTRLGFGLQYASFTHSYHASRSNPGGFLTSRYDPQDDDGSLNNVTNPNQRYEDTPDFDLYIYDYHFRGFGPKLGLGGAYPAAAPLQVYARAAGMLVMGQREESVTIFSDQQGVFAGGATAAERAQFANGGRLIFTRSLNVTVGRSKFVTMPGGELEAGVTLHLGYGGTFDPVLRLGGIVQYWSQGGNSTNPNAGLLLFGGMGSVGLAF